MRPLRYLVYSKRTPPLEKHEGTAIIIPDAYQKRVWEGVVVAVGPLVTTLKEGDSVIIDRHTGIDVYPDGEEHLFTHEKDVSGVVENGNS